MFTAHVDSTGLLYVWEDDKYGPPPYHFTYPPSVFISSSTLDGFPFLWDIKNGPEPRDIKLPVTSTAPVVPSGAQQSQWSAYPIVQPPTPVPAVDHAILQDRRPPWLRRTDVSRPGASSVPKPSANLPPLTKSPASSPGSEPTKPSILMQALTFAVLTLPAWGTYLYARRN